MSTPFDSEDPVKVDRWIREYYKLTDESTDAFLIRNRITEDSPRGFVARTNMALAWLWPQLTTRTAPLYYQIKTLIDDLNTQASGVRVWHPPIAFPPPRVTEEVAKTQYVAKREQVMLLLEQVVALNRLEPTVAAQEAYRQAQSTRASKLRKTSLDEDTRKRIAKLYWDRKASGTAYGLVKELAGRHDVTPTTIQAIVKQYKPNSIDK
jgi:hypothetical protein